MYAVGGSYAVVKCSYRFFFFFQSIDKFMLWNKDGAPIARNSLSSFHQRPFLAQIWLGIFLLLHEFRLTFLPTFSFLRLRREHFTVYLLVLISNLTLKKQVQRGLLLRFQGLFFHVNSPSEYSEHDRPHPASTSIHETYKLKIDLTT